MTGSAILSRGVGAYPDQAAPIVRRQGEKIVLQNARCGMPSPKRHHSASGSDRGVTNIRNTKGVANQAKPNAGGKMTTTTSAQAA